MPANHPACAGTGFLHFKNEILAALPLDSVAFLFLSHHSEIKHEDERVNGNGIDDVFVLLALPTEKIL